MSELKARLEKFYSKNLIVVVMGLMFVIMLIGFTVVGSNLRNIEDLRAGDRQDDIDHQVDLCHSSNSSRLMVRSLFEVAMDSESPLLGVNFEEVDGWNELDSETQLYLGSLTVALSNPETQVYILDLMDRYAKTNPVENCEDLRDKLEMER